MKKQYIRLVKFSHEILNPLNFINNFAELSSDLVQEIITTKDEAEKKETTQLLQENLLKINGHGKRAEEIVKQLQEHSRKGSAHEFFEENQ